MRILAAMAILVLSRAAVAGPVVGGCPVFPANNYWNTPVDTLPVHPSSQAWVASVGNFASLHPDWGNVLADNYGIPYATVTGAQPGVAITFPPQGYADESDAGPMPIPPDAPIEGGPASDGDRHVLVVETTHCILYELYYAFPLPGGAGWSVYSSAKYDLGSNALRPRDWTSADAAGLPIFPGLVRYEEVAAGEIAHAIRFTAARIWGKNADGSYKYLWPARHGSGSSTDSTRPPMGARFRLKAAFDISRFDARTQVILRAMKRYGLVLADAGSNWYFQGVSDTRWPDVVFDQLKTVAGSNFEVVDTSVMQVNPDTAEARQSGSPPSTSYQGLWWGGRPAGTESGWGVNIAHQGDTLFATWFTYGADGNGMWLVMPNVAKTAEGYTGAIYRTTGPAFNRDPWPSSQVSVAPAGVATFLFNDANNGTFTYTLDGVTQTKPITKQVFAFPVPTCVVAQTFAPSSNYTGLWWRAPAGSESGWGLNVAHQGDVLFVTWFTYDDAGKGLWLVMSNGVKTGPGVYSGTLFRTTGPVFSAVPWSGSLVTIDPVGNATLTFGDFDNGTFAYTVDGVSQSKAITRQVFAVPATVCN